MYFIRAANGLTKIGITKNLYTRLGALDVSSPIELSLVYFAITPTASQTEKKLHEKFSTKRVKGEWFNLSNEDMQWIKELYDTQEEADIPC